MLSSGPSNGLVRDAVPAAQQLTVKDHSLADEGSL